MALATAPAGSCVGNGRATHGPGGAWRSTLIVFAMLWTVFGCGRGQPEPTADELAERAAAATDALTSVHFLLRIDGGPAYLDPGRTLNLRQAEGDLARPDRAQAAAKVAIGGFVVTIKFITIGRQEYMTDPLTGRWGPPPAGLGYNAAYLFDAEGGISATIRRVEKLAAAGEQRVDDVATYHLTGELATEHLRVLTGGVLAGERVKVDLWVAKEDAQLRQIRLTEVETVKAPMTWTLTLSQHNHPVSIEPPQQ